MFKCIFYVHEGPILSLEIDRGTGIRVGLGAYGTVSLEG